MAYNEADSLVTVTKEIWDCLTGTQNSQFELLLINDGSTDDTDKVADTLSKKYPHVRVINHRVNLGLGEVYRSGFLHAKGDFVTFFPADGQFPAEIILNFLKLMDNYDMVLGYLPKRKSSLVSKTLSKLQRLIFILFFGSFPKFQGVLMFRKEMLEKIPLKSKGRAGTVLLEFILRASKSGYRLTSIPTQMRSRVSGKSKVNNLRTILANLKQVLILRIIF